jgi:MFS family permease
VLFIGLLCFVVFLTEGAMLDWSAVFLVEMRNVDFSRAGLGYAAFATTMTIGRLSGDAIVRRLGHKVVVGLGGMCAAAGLGVATLSPAWQVAVVGYALVGIGCSNIVPVMYSLVGKQAVMPEAVAVSAITTMGYAGILLGPALIGFVAHATSLTTAFLVVAASLLCVSASAKTLEVRT